MTDFLNIYINVLLYDRVNFICESDQNIYLDLKQNPTDSSVRRKEEEETLQLCLMEFFTTERNSRSPMLFVEIRSLGAGSKEVL